MEQLVTAASRELRLGELLWAGSTGLWQARPCPFFPRQWFGALALPRAAGNGCSLILMGGSQNGHHRNDVWRLIVPSSRRNSTTKSPLRWVLMSPHDDGDLDGHGRRVLRKWRGRHDFGCCAAAATTGGLLVYVAAGSASGVLLNDVWASEDAGATWVCMTKEAPWEKRIAPALCAVQGKPECLVLAGGMASCAEVCGDVWVSDSTGCTWTKIDPPPWACITGRYRASLLPLPSSPREPEDTCTSRMLLLGGCFIDGQDIADISGESPMRSACSGGGGTIGLERLMADAWECQFDWGTRGGLGGCASWMPWGTDSEQRGAYAAKRGLESASVTLDQEATMLVAKLPELDSVCVAPAEPPFASIEWQQIPCTDTTGVRKGVPRSTDAAKAGWKLVYVRLANTNHTLIPRLLLANTEGAWVSDDAEWSRHLHLASLVGLHLHREHGLPPDLWYSRVLPYLLPEVNAECRDIHTRSCHPAGNIATTPQGTDAVSTGAGDVWGVVSGADRGGIIVRRGQEFGSERLEQRLSFGALVEQEELVRERLRYRLLTGTGPPTGWVSIRLQGRDLLRRRQSTVQKA